MDAAPAHGAPLRAEALLAGLATRWLGRELHCLEHTDSTMRVAGELAARGAAHGAAVIAEEQSAGRGRLGRSFHSPPGANLYVSILLRPTPPGMLAPTLVLAAGVAVAESVAAFLDEPARVDLKWPNDVRIDRRKTSGILVELASEASRPVWAVLGIGVNLNVDPASFPEEFRRRATSLAAASGRPVDRVAFAQHLFGTLERVLDLHASQGFAGVRPRFEAWFRMGGQPVRVLEPAGHTLEGRVAGVDPDGALRLRLAGAGERRVLAGEVTVLPEEDAALSQQPLPPEQRA
jgi:BirA family biotin operon repressor/biotin-[acetyl-CoA-carboxylase] ligase